MTETKNLKLKTYETTTDGQELVARYIDNTSDNFQKIDEFCKTDTTLSVEGGIADAKTVGDNVSKLKEDLDKMSTATPEDVGKTLVAKTVKNGKVTEWEFGEAGSKKERLPVTATGTIVEVERNIIDTFTVASENGSVAHVAQKNLINIQPFTTNSYSNKIVDKAIIDKFNNLPKGVKLRINYKTTGDGSYSVNESGSKAVQIVLSSGNETVVTLRDTTSYAIPSDKNIDN